MSDSSASIGRAGLTAVVVNVVLGVFGFLSAALVNRLLGPVGRGELAVIQTVPSLLVILAMAGLPDAVTYLITQDGERSGRYVATATVLVSIVSVAFMALAYLTAPIILSGKPDRLIDAYRFYLLIIPLLGLFMLWTQPLRSRGLYGRWNTSRLAVGASWLAVVAVAWSLQRDSPEAISRWHVFSFAGLLVIGVAGARSAYPGGFRIERTLAEPLLRFGIPTATAAAPQLLNLRVDQMIMVVLVPERQLGYYAAAVGWSWIVNPPLHALGHLLFPVIAAEPDMDRRKMSFERGARLGITAAFVIFIGCAAVTPFAFTLAFGQAYTPAIGVAILTVASGTIAALNLSLEEATKGLGKPRVVLRAEMTGLVVTAVLIFPMIHFFGIVGAAIASILAYSTTLVILLWAAQTSLGSNWRDLIVATRDDVEALWSSIAPRRRDA